MVARDSSHCHHPSLHGAFHPGPGRLAKPVFEEVRELPTCGQDPLANQRADAPGGPSDPLAGLGEGEGFHPFLWRHRAGLLIGRYSLQACESSGG